MIRINVYITKKQREVLKELSQNGLTLSEHIRRAIDEYTKPLYKEIEPNKFELMPSVTFRKDDKNA